MDAAQNPIKNIYKSLSVQYCPKFLGCEWRSSIYCILWVLSEDDVHANVSFKQICLLVFRLVTTFGR